MRAFEYSASSNKLLTPEIVQMMSKIHEHKGKQYIETCFHFQMFRQRANLRIRIT